MSTICAVVVSLPERHELLKEALDSVHAQRRKPDDVVIGVDSRHYGEAGNMNRLIRATDAEWLAFLHDDDIWLPDHLEAAEFYVDDHDVIVARVTLVGREHIERQHDDFRDLRHTNWFPPSAVVVRKSVFGEWCDKNERHCWVDWANWNRLLDAGARFVHTNEATFLYRFGEWDNGSFKITPKPGWETSK
jgi:glycosyltransferase involved in cell wall biosynthesis